MTKQTIDIGTGPNTNTGDPLRTAFTKLNENFTEVYNTTNSNYTSAVTGLSVTNSGSSAYLIDQYLMI